MRTRFALVFGLGLLSPTPAQATPPATTAAELMPLQVGARWVYDVTRTSLPPTKPVRSTVVDEGRCVLPDGEEVHQLRVETAGENAPRFEAWSLGDAGIRRFLALDDRVRGAIDFASAPLRWLDWPARKGDSWRWQGKHDVAFASDGHGWTHQATVVGTEEAITVPAGSFRAVHVRVESAHENVRQLLRELWFAPGVGLVRERHEDAEHDVERVLVAFAKPTDDREARVQRHLEEELANPKTPAWNNTPFVQWLEAGPEALWLPGAIAVVHTDTGSRLYYVGEKVLGFAVNQRELLAASLRDAFGTETARLPNHVPIDALALLLARAEAARLGFERVREAPVTLKPQYAPHPASHRRAAVEVIGGARDGTDRRVALWIDLRRQSDVQFATDYVPPPAARQPR